MSLVLDSSVTLAWCFEDERTSATERLFRQVAKAGAVVPPLWRLEVANGFQMALRKGRINVAYRDATLADLGRLPLDVDAETDRQAWAATLHLADKYRLTVYDAVYLELALRRDLPLATLDKALRAAGRSAGVGLLGK